MIYRVMAPFVWVKGAIAVAAVAATVPALRMLWEPIKELFSEESWELANLVGWTGVTDVDKVTTTFGWAVVRRGDRENKYHQVEVRTREGVISPRGSRVLLEEFEPEARYFWVVKIEDEEELVNTETDALGETEAVREDRE